MADSADSSGLVAVVDGILADEEEADAILRRVVALLADGLGTRVALRFVEEGGWIEGPVAGAAAGGTGEAVAVRYDGEQVAELACGRPLAAPERDVVAQVAERVAVFCLVGWDTGGEDWEP